MLVSFALGDANGFASQWHIGHNVNVSPVGVVLTNVVNRVTLLSSYTADRISPFKLGALLQKDGNHKTSDD